MTIPEMSRSPHARRRRVKVTAQVARMFQATVLPTLIAAFICAGSPVTPALAGITADQCHADLQLLLTDIETNRKTALKHIIRQISETEIQQERQSLETMREQIWDQEERQRGRAHYIWRDCMVASQQHK